MGIVDVLKPPRRPAGASDDSEELHDENLFESYPGVTLGLMAAGCGFIAVATLALELSTAQTQAAALEIPVRYLSLPMGVGTMILAGLVARMNWTYAMPALVLGAIYWIGCVAGLFI